MTNTHEMLLRAPPAPDSSLTETGTLSDEEFGVAGGSEQGTILSTDVVFYKRRETDRERERDRFRAGGG